MIQTAQQLVTEMDNGVVEAIGYCRPRGILSAPCVVVRCLHCGAVELTKVTRVEMLEESNSRRTKDANRENTSS